ncbi:hypothetical protein [Methanolacinia paynteri]|uniref:hypothetical protein n=1 Tax=Methanolacinia paynteri TaxID=230356 RepID=UPI0012F641BB|nr:hypothetical protein [Methanolacinia paynteri]
MKIGTFLIAAAMLALLVSAGCTDSGSQSSGGGSSSGNSDGLTYSLSSGPVQHYRSDGTCYYRVETVDVRNNGADDARNVVARCNLVDPSTNEVVDTYSKYFEVIEAGDHQGFSVSLNGECGTAYKLEVEISRDEK